MAVLPPDPVFNLRTTDMGAVNCLCFHSSERLFSGTAKGAIYLWDMQVFSLKFMFLCGEVRILNDVFSSILFETFRQIDHHCIFPLDVNRCRQFIMAKKR